MASSLTVVGGGITGLATAYLAAKAGRRVTIMEAGETFGGLLNTFPIGGNHLEFYYHHFFTHDAELRWLLGELGISDKLRFHEASMGVFREGQVYPFNSPVDLLKFRPLGWMDKVRFGFSSLYLGKVAQWRDYEGVSAAQWLRHYAGKGTAEALWQPLLNIKFGPHAEKVPLAWMVGRMRQRMNSRQRGDERLGYLDGSLQVLLDALLRRLQQMGVEMIPNCALQGVEIGDGQLQLLKTSQGEFSVEQVAATIPSVYLAPLLQEAAPALAEALGRTQYFGAVCTILELDRPLSDIYWLNVADAGFPFGGVIEHTNLIPAQHYGGRHIAYLSRYFDWGEPIAQMDKGEITDLMLSALPKLYPSFDKRWLKAVHVFKTRTAATVCDLHYSQKVPKCRTEVGGLFVANMSHIYPDERSTNNAIRVAAAACQSMGIPTDEVPHGASLSAQIGFG